MYQIYGTSCTMLVGNLISTIFNNIKQSTLLFSTHSVLQGPIGSDPP